MASPKQHQFIPVKFTTSTAKSCKLCGSLLLPNVQDTYSCSECDYLIHRKCMVTARGISPCTNVDLRSFPDAIIKSDFMELYVLLPKIQKKRKSINTSLSTTKKSWFILTSCGVLYYAKDSEVNKPSGAILLSDQADIVPQKERKIVIIGKEKDDRENITLLAPDTASRDSWIEALKPHLQNPTYVSSGSNHNSKRIGWYSLLNVKICEAKNLPAVDIQGTSDCYCIVTCEHGFGRTITIWNNNKNPFWGETFHFDIEDPDTAILRVFILDESSISTDEVLGDITIPIQSVGDKTHSAWYPVEKPIAYVSGEIILHITRTEKTLKVKAVEGRNLPSADPNGKSDPYLKLEFGGQKKKSKIVKKTLNPVFNEEFEFLVGKTSDSNLYVDVYDYDVLERRGRFVVKIPSSEFPLHEVIEKRCLLEPRETPEEIEAFREKNAEANLGEIRVETSMIKRQIHEIVVYDNLLKLLTRSDLEVIFLLQNYPKEKGEFASILMRIFDSQGQIVRLAQALTNHEIELTPNPDIIFRGNTMVTKTLDALMKFVGASYQSSVLAPILSDICRKKAKSYEVDPMKEKKQNVKKNKTQLVTLCNSILARIFSSVEECPPIMAVVFYNIRNQVEQKYEAEQIAIVKYTAISAFVFLRFFCPAIINPKLFGFVAKLAETPARTCTLLAKLIQNLANLVHFGEKEPYMHVFDSFIDDNIPKMKEFIDQLCERGKQFAGQTFPPLSIDTWLEKELAMAAIHIRRCQNRWYDEENVTAKVLAKELDLIHAMDESNGDHSMELTE